jgi:hypothetical protein
MTIIRDASTGTSARVDENNNLHVFAVTESEVENANAKGCALNINTGLIALTGTGDSAIVYFKNDESVDYVITGLVVGVGIRSATTTDYPLVTIVKDPTAGTIISNATAVDMKSNSNFGSSNAFASTTLAYKGVDGATLTDGSDHAIVMIGEGRTFISIPIELARGHAMGVNIDLNTSGGANVYCAIIGYIKDANAE